MTTPDLEELLARMTWAEKLAQLQIIWRRDEDDALALARGGIGALFWPRERRTDERACSAPPSKRARTASRC